MAEVRCMMCGKPNPAEAEVCQYCQARIKPLMSSSADTAPEQPPVSPAEMDESGAGSSVPDWLASLRQEGEEDQPQPSPENEWMDEDVTVQDTPSPSTDDQQDWLSSLRRDSGELVEPDWDDDIDQDEWLDSEDVPLFGIDREVNRELSAEEDTSVANQTPPIPGVSRTAADSHEKVEPEWLNRIRSRQRGEQAEITGVQAREAVSSKSEFASAERSASDDKKEPSGMPDWLSEFEAEQPDAEEALDLPDWLRTEQQDSQPLPADQDRAQEELPEWLSEFSPEEGQKAGEDSAQEADKPQPPAVAPLAAAMAAVDMDTPVPGVSDDLDIWYEDFPGEAAELEALESDEGTEKVDWLPELSRPEAEEAETDLEAVDQDLPEWLFALEKSAPTAKEVDVSLQEDQPELDLEWLEDSTPGEESLPVFGEEAEAGEGEGELPEKIGPFVGDFPELLDDDLVFSGTYDELEESQPADLEHADLPNWLETMRPVEAAAAAPADLKDSDTQVESSGPLAGLQGVLPAEPEIAGLKQMGALAVKLKVSDKQQAQIAILSDLVRTEAEAKSLPKRPVITSQHMLRILILVVLIVVIGLSAYRASQSQPVPGFTQGIFETNTIINELPEKAPVLLAVDYEPGLAGEMEAVSSGIVDHLMIKGAFLTLVSTSPTGPAQAERLIQVVNSRGGHQYTGHDQYANLGYIPGGPTGLLAFASRPRQILPFSTDGALIWELAPLANIQNLEQFAFVAVITEDPEKARAWIEQVQPVLGETPLVMMLSAQAEPLVLPYYAGAAQQVQGIVTGLAGGATYEQLVNRPGPGRQYWDSFSLASIVAALLILLGTIFNVVSGSVNIPKILKGESE